MTLMGWSDFLYLAVGLGLGLVSHRVFSQRQQPSVEVLPTPTAEPPHTSGLDEVQSLSKQLKQSQLAYQMASEMSKFKAGFLARTSHELRSPLNSMIGTLQLILSDLCDSPEEEREFIQQAHNSALKMVGLMDEIIAVAKTEHGTEIMDIQPLELAKIFEEVDDLTYLQATNRGIRLTITPPDPSIKVLADLRRFRQVLVSLVDTAIAEMDEGSIFVSAHPSPETGYVHIWVDDQRPVSAWSESWDLLKRDLEATQTPAGDVTKLSSGLRLLMNQTLLELMKGRLEVLAVPSEGEDCNFTRTQCSIPLEK